MTQPTPHPRHLAIFAKYWNPGSVKTRLATHLGNAAACGLHRCFVRHLLQQLSSFDAVRTLAIWPPSAIQAARRESPPDWLVEAQSDGDLGQKMTSFIQSHLDAGSRQLVLIGADSPDIPLERIEQAFRLLNERQVVLGPATDGGYYLLGIRAWTPIFDDIAWGTDAVFAQTVQRLEQLGVSHAILEPWHDVDRVADLEHLQKRLSRQPTSPAAAQLLREIRQTLCESTR